MKFFPSFLPSVQPFLCDLHEDDTKYRQRKRCKYIYICNNAERMKLCLMVKKDPLYMYIYIRLPVKIDK